MLRVPRNLTKLTFCQVKLTPSASRLPRLSVGTPIPSISWRNASTSARGNGTKRRRLAFVSGSVLLALGLSPLVSTIYADSAAPDPTKEMSLKELIRAYAVYTMCSIPTLVDHSPKLLQLALNTPGINWFAEKFIRATFFDQFVGGDTIEKTLPVLFKLRATNKGALFAYSVEVDEAEATASSSSTKGKHEENPPHKQIVNEMIRCVDVAADFEDEISGKRHTGRRTWVAIKMSALIPDANSLVRLSSHVLNTRPKQSIAFPGCPHVSDLDVLNKPPVSQDPDTLTADDITSLRELHSDLVRICTRAQERGIKIIVDAEYSWYQPAIDALTLSLTRQFNQLPSRKNPDTSKVQPLVYATYQAYLQRTPAHLAQALADAKAGNYALGVKLVRGAYHNFEVAAYQARLEHKPSLSISPDAQPPVWLTKPETDARYNECARMLIGSIKDDMSTRRPKDAPLTPALGVLFGTHNWESCDVILEELVKAGLARKGPEKDDLVLLPDDVTERVTIGQLYGMCDDLTNHLVNTVASNTPLIIKYVPYSTLSEAMPYLSRRAIENKSVLGEGMAVKERRRAGAEIKKRLFPWFK